MIQSAMIFALGVFVSGLAWLALSVALVRRARRLTERRLFAGIAVRRAEFETERDELRARHAVQMYRLEREVSRVLDMATAHRLEADLKERDLVNARAELVADEEDFVDIERRLSDERQLIQDLERRHAEVGTALRSAQHALKLEAKRRETAEEALDEATLLADQRRLALISLRSENDQLRARLGEDPSAPLPFELADARMPRADSVEIESEEEEDVAAEELEAARPQLGGSVVPLPTRHRPAAAASVAPADDDVIDFRHISSEARDGSRKAQPPRMPATASPGAANANVGELVALRMAAPPAAVETSEADPPALDEPKEGPEQRFFAALAEIRALKRAASQPGE
jgi:hypothetical protein